MSGSITIGAAELIIASFREQLATAQRTLLAAQREVDLRAADLARAEKILTALRETAQ